MIRINLLPVVRKKKKKPKPVPTFLIIGALLLTVSIIASLYYDRYFLRATIASLENKKKENDGKLDELKEKIAEVDKFKAYNMAFTYVKDTIEKLRKNQSLPVKILDEMSRRLTDGIWLTDMGMDIDGNKITIEGIGFSNQEVVTFVQNLKASPLYKEVYLHGTDKGAIEKIDIYKFKITLQVQA